ncbi:hypothetical protein [Halococcus qingdaonensis]|uniref:hypothetical protein n=1 Tax=Halococcus qingdaonensis TaxID=224402 RepID=UPI003F862E1B
MRGGGDHGEQVTTYERSLPRRRQHRFDLLARRVQFGGHVRHEAVVENGLGDRRELVLFGTIDVTESSRQPERVPDVRDGGRDRVGRVVGIDHAERVGQ